MGDTTARGLRRQGVEKGGTPPYISPNSVTAEIRFPFRACHLHLQSSAREANFNSLLAMPDGILYKRDALLEAAPKVEDFQLRERLP